MVCEMTISAAGRVSGYQFYEAIMHSHARLTYTQVASIIDAKDSEHQRQREAYYPLLKHLANLQNLYHALRERREQRGAIDFETTETRIEFDTQRKIKNIVPVVRNEAHMLIEECMLAANVCAAKCLESHKIAALFRVHESPKLEKAQQFYEIPGI